MRLAGIMFSLGSISQTRSPIQNSEEIILLIGQILYFGDSLPDCKGNYGFLDETELEPSTVTSK